MPRPLSTLATVAWRTIFYYVYVLQATGLAIIEQRLKQTRQDKASKHTIKTNYLDNELDDSGSSTGMSAPGQ